MNILVVGAGAVGGYYGAYLVRAGHAVTFVARGENGRAIREHGLVVESADGEFRVRAPVVTDVRDAAGLGAELVLVAVKWNDLASVASGIGEALAGDGVALPLLNGLDSEEELARVIGRDHVIGGVAQLAARLVAPGRVHVDGPGKLVIAPLLPEQTPLVGELAKTLGAAGFGCDAKPDLARVLWTKLLWNAPFNAICALTRKTAGEVLAVPALEALVRDAMRELAAVARAEGVPFDDAFIDATISVTRTKFSGSVPSMLQDVLRGAETEAEALQGAVVRRGRAHGISTPIHAALLALLLGLR